MLNRSRVVARSWPPALWLLLIHNSVIIHKHDDDGKTVLKDHNDVLSTNLIHDFFFQQYYATLNTNCSGL